MLYFSLVGSQIEYALIWCTISVEIKAFQNNILRYVSYKCNVERTHSAYNSVGDFFKIDCSKNRYVILN